MSFKDSGTKVKKQNTCELLNYKFTNSVRWLAKLSTLRRVGGFVKIIITVISFVLFYVN